jgi:sensitive to high expression protein 9
MADLAWTVLTFRSEVTLETARKTARQAKTAYDQAVADRSTAQRQVNSLLERKHSWTDADVSTFTTLVRTDHASTLAVTTTSVSLKECEMAVDKAFSDLTSAILQRYHEEQVWSDKIRSVATWANIAGFLFNFFIFVIAIAIVEPWKRKRLVERVEERMTSLIARLETRVGDLAHRLESAKSSSPDVASPTGPLIESTAANTNHSAPDPDISGLSMPNADSPQPNLAMTTKRLLSMVGHPDVVLSPIQNEVVTGAIGAAAGIALCTLLSFVFR